MSRPGGELAEPRMHADEIDTDDVVVPDTSTDDPTVQEAEAAAAADAANIGGDTDSPRGS